MEGLKFLLLADDNEKAKFQLSSAIELLARRQCPTIDIHCHPTSYQILTITSHSRIEYKKLEHISMQSLPFRAMHWLDQGFILLL